MKNKKFRPSAIELICIFTICVIATCFFYIRFLEQQYNSELKEALRRETGQIENSVNRLVEGEFNRLEYLTEFMLEQDKKFDYEKCMERLNLISAGNYFEELGIADTQGKAYTLDGTDYDISDEEYYKASLDGSRYISDAMTEEEGLLIYSCPIMIDSKVVGVIFGKGSQDDIKEAMNIPHGLLNHQSCIVDKKGNIIIDNMFEDSAESHTRIMDYLNDSKYSDSAKKIESNYKRDRTDFSELRYEGDDKIFYAAHFDYNDWHLITMVSKEAISEYRNSTLLRTRLVMGVFVGVYGVVIVLIFVIKKRNKKNIERIAYVDELTGGNTYAKFERIATKLLSNVNSKYAIIDLDIDRFKYINDIFGYEEGNEVICKISRTISEAIEKDETFGHMSADEFVILMRADDMERLITRIKDLFKAAANKNDHNDKNYEIVLSMGIYVFEKYAERLDVALDMAKMTKKTIKGKHKQFYAIYDENMRKRILREQEIEGMMERALKNEEFKVYYQPKYDAATSELSGAEALVRWYSEGNGMVFPNEFIPVFENNGFITELDKYMFDHVCRDVRRWIDEGYKAVPVSVNLSQLQLYNTKFIEEYREILEKYKIPPEYVQLELTETTLFSKISTINKIIDELHGIGFKILMDDFGTGYSSLSMLKNVPIDILKLDKSFVDDIGESKGDIVVSTIVSLGQLLNMKIVAEGVETQEQFEFLRDIFCDEIQGYYFSKPVPEEEYRGKMQKYAEKKAN